MSKAILSKDNFERYLSAIALPLVGAGAVVALWSLTSATFAETLPSPSKTWEVSRPYIVEPFEKRGELDQGILRFTWYSLERVVQGYAIAILIGAPVGFLLGMSKLFQGSFDCVMTPLIGSSACTLTRTSRLLRPT